MGSQGCAHPRPCERRVLPSSASASGDGGGLCRTGSRASSIFPWSSPCSLGSVKGALPSSRSQFRLRGVRHGDPGDPIRRWPFTLPAPAPGLRLVGPCTRSLGAVGVGLLARRPAGWPLARGSGSADWPGWSSGPLQSLATLWHHMAGAGMDSVGLLCVIRVVEGDARRGSLILGAVLGPAEWADLCRRDDSYFGSLHSSESVALAPRAPGPSVRGSDWP